MLCPHCQAPTADDARFCGACGRATSMTEPTSNPNLGEAPALIGRVIAGRYRILSKLGEGGMGAVYQAEQISLKRTVAVKLLRPDVSASPMLLRRFNAEAEAVAKLRHPNTVNIYDFGQDTDGTLFIAMELIEGRSLRTVIHREAPLSLRRTLSIASQVAASLADAHGKTIIHRDLKPDNVMLTDRGRSKDNVTVLDFGIAKLRDDSRGTQHQMTQAGDMLGTPQYMAPEQIRGEQIDGRTDVYALGGMIYEMVTARLPYEAPTVMALLSKHLVEQLPPPSQRRPDLGLPPMIDDLVMTAMAKDVAARPATMEDFGERIAAVLASLPPEPSAQRSAVVGVPSAHTPTPNTPPAYSVAASGFAPPSSPPPGAPVPPPPSTPLPQGPAPSAPSPGFAPPHGPPGFAPPPHGAPQPAPYGYGGPPAPYPGGPQPTGTPPPQPSPFGPGPAPSGGGSKLMWVLVAVLLLGAAGTGIYFATRGPGGKTVADARLADPDDPDDPNPDKPTREPDEWDRKPDARLAPDPDDDDDDPPAPPDPDDDDDAPAAGVPGKVVDVGQGVRVIAPPGMSVKREQGGVVIGTPRKLAIIAGPIVEKSNDPDALARAWEKSTGLKIQGSEMREIAGKRRKLFVLGGTAGTTAVVQAGVALIGPGYRVGVIVHAVVDPTVDQQALLKRVEDIFARRILVPSAAM